MDRPIHPTAATQTRVGCVGDGIHALTRDIAGFELEAPAGDRQASCRHRLTHGVRR